MTSVAVASSIPEPVQSAPREAWILAGTLDGVAAEPTLLQDVCGMPHVLRLACDLALAGARRIYVIWAGPAPAPELVEIGCDPRLAARATLYVVTRPPTGDAADAILISRADRIAHRDVAKQIAAAFDGSRLPLAKLAGTDHDAIVATDRATAAQLALLAPGRGALTAQLAFLVRADEVLFADPPYLGFTLAAPDRRARRRAERRLVWSLRKTADGIAAKAVNRHLSLPVTWLVCRTRIQPNHVTLIALVCALAGGFVISRGGYVAGVAGMMLVELGSIIDGIDGELARLRFQFSRTGQWLDTIVDDVANIAYVAGVIASLTAAGVTWAMPLGVAALTAFAITQISQYLLITFVYRSGDLAAIPWAFQSARFLSQRPRGLRAWIAATTPKLLKRDFVVSLFAALALFDQLDLILHGFSAGAFSFFVVFVVQLVRNRRSLAAVVPAR